MMLPTGWCPGDRAMADMLAMYPDTSAVRVFFQPGEGLPASAWTDPRQELSQAPYGSTVIVSHKDVDVDAGAFVDAGRAARPDVRCILLPHHEPEQQTGGDPTPAQFDASWTRTREQVGDHPARAEGWLRLAVCYTLVWVRQGNDWRKWFPDHEADAVDLVLGDWYPYMPGTATPWKPTQYEDPASALKVLEDIAAATGKGWGVAEINHSEITKANGYSVDLDPTGVLCADWYRRMHAHAKARGCQVWTHFHRGGGDLGNRPAMLQALRTLIGQEASMGRVKSLGGYPIEQYSSPNIGGAMTGHKGLVLHIAEGTYRGTISWQMNPDQRYASGGSVTTSSTWIVGREPGEWAQMVDADRIAWCQRGGSYDWNSIELAGYAPNAPTAWQVEACAQLLAWHHRTYGTPIQVTSSTVTRGLGHHSMDNDSTVEWGHDSCPGSGVINAKSAIVARAKQIINGEDDIVTPEDIETIATKTKLMVLSDGGMQNLFTRVYNLTVSQGQLVTAMKALPGTIAAEGTNATELDAALDAATAALTNPAEIVAGVLAGLTPEAIAAAIPPELARQVADELAARLAS